MADFSENKETSTKPRRNRGPRGPRRSSGGGGEGRRRREGDDEKRELRSVPVPPELIGTTVAGRICDIVRRGRGQFGFIFIGDDENSSRADTPRVYFNFKDYTETKFPPRRGYLVQFTCAEDDEKRVLATDVKLTEQGLQEATIREEEFQKKVASGEQRAPRERRERRERSDEDEIPVALKVTCEGKVGEKQITVKLSQSIGKLKHTAAEEFDAVGEYTVYCHVSSENPEGTLLTRAILAEMTDNDVIHLKPSAEK